VDAGPAACCSCARCDAQRARHLDIDEAVVADVVGDGGHAAADEVDVAQGLEPDDDLVTGPGFPVRRNDRPRPKLG
jgi:hypothetical protein